MIVCVCNGLSERDVRSVAEPTSAVGDIYRQLGCRVMCGKCVPHVAELLQAVRTPALIGPVATEPDAAQGRRRRVAA
jgi:bacterioferritin-associated ferredoxin